MSSSSVSMACLSSSVMNAVFLRLKFAVRFPLAASSSGVQLTFISKSILELKKESMRSRLVNGLPLVLNYKNEKKNSFG